MDILQAITDLSHEFGTVKYVRGGGGNTSCKDETTLWVKPSGTTLGGLKPETFVAMDRAKLSELYDIESPDESSAREALVKEKMANAVLPNSSGRASVEAPLHDSLNARYVVHTHPAIVNGMTCSKNGAAVCAELFPDALWLDYIDPGYTLCMKVRQEIINYKAANGVEPSMIFLKNHGVFVSADEPEQIRELYSQIMSRLNAKYDQAEITISFDVPPAAVDVEKTKEKIHAVTDNPNLYIAAGGDFPVPGGPISPDHIVYSKSYMFIGQPTADAVAQYKTKHGFLPQVFAFDGAVFGVADSEKSAGLALELAYDGFIVEKLAGVFGGIDYMTDQAREFIENWEVESYRKKQI